MSFSNEKYASINNFQKKQNTRKVQATSDVFASPTLIPQGFGRAESLDFRIENNLHYGKFFFSGLRKGQGLTVANSLRRILLYDLQGIGISHGKVSNKNSNKTYHEFSNIPGIRESILELLMNMRSIVWGQEKASDRTLWSSKKEYKGEFSFENFFSETSSLKIPEAESFILQAKHLNIPKNSGLFIVNPDQYLATIVVKKPQSTPPIQKEGILEVDELSGLLFEYIISDFSFENSNSGLEIGEPKFNSSDFLPTDGNFFPVKRVNYSIQESSQGEAARRHQENLTDENVFFEIWTNGSIHPKEALNQGFSSFLNIFHELQLSLGTKTL